MSTPKRRLVYARRNGDLPELQIEGFQLSEKEEIALSRELSDRYQNLVGQTSNQSRNKGYKIVTLATQVLDFPDPQAFYIKQVKSRDARTPNLIFLPKETTSSNATSQIAANASRERTDPPKTTNSVHWPAHFLRDANRLLTESHAQALRPADREVLKEIVEEMREQSTKNTDSFTLLMTWGYIALGQKHLDASDESRKGGFLLAERGLNLISQRVLHQPAGGQQTGFQQAGPDKARFAPLQFLKRLLDL